MEKKERNNNLIVSNSMIFAALFFLSPLPFHFSIENCAQSTFMRITCLIKRTVFTHSAHVGMCIRMCSPVCGCVYVWYVNKHFTAKCSFTVLKHRIWRACLWPQNMCSSFRVHLSNIILPRWTSTYTSVDYTFSCHWTILIPWVRMCSWENVNKTYRTVFPNILHKVQYLVIVASKFQIHWFDDAPSESNRTITRHKYKHHTTT